MNKLKITLFMITFLSTISLYAQTKNIEGIEFTNELSINNYTFVLNGGGLREKLGFLDLYVGGLYLSKTNSDANQIIMSNNPMAVVLLLPQDIHDRFIEALEEGFKNTTVGKYTQLEIESTEYLSDPFKLGDDILVYIRGGKYFSL